LLSSRHRRALIVARGFLEGLAFSGATRFWRQASGLGDLTQTGGTCLAGALRQPATCVQAGGSVAAVFEATGRTTWTFAAPQAWRALASATADRVFVATDTGFLYALDAASGQVRFRVRIGGTFDGPPVIGAGLVVTVGRDGPAARLAAVEATSGRPTFSLSLEMRRASAPVLCGQRVVVGGISETAAQVVTFTRSGREAGRATLSGDSGLPALVARRGSVFGGLRDGGSFCLDRRAPCGGGFAREEPSSTGPCRRSSGEASSSPPAIPSARSTRRPEPSWRSSLQRGA